MNAVHEAARALVVRADPRAEPKDADYLFIGFVTRHFPAGLVGLLLAVIFSAAMSSTASALSALGSTSVVDFYKVSVRPGRSDGEYLLAARLFTVLWGVVAMLFAAFAALIDNLIQAVNIIGSLFYGTMLGVFVVGMFLKRVRATPVFIGAVIAQATVLLVFATTPLGYLWYNPLGCGVVVLVALAADKLTSAMPPGDRPPAPGPPAARRR